MSGILDNKSRIIDAVLTYEGRRQMAQNTFKIKYASFTDRGVNYVLDATEGHVDPTKKIYLESFNAPYDQITFEADDSGTLIGFRQHGTLSYQSVTGSVTSSVGWTSFVNGKIISRLQTFSQSSTLTGSYADYPVSGSSFASQLEGILTSSFDNFKSLCVLGTADPLFEDQNFALSSNEIAFTLSNNNTNWQMIPPTNINTIDSLFNDEKTRNAENFLYLPPIIKTNSNIDKTNIEALSAAGLLLGDYPAWGPIQKLSYSDIVKELEPFEQDSRTITFDPTSRDNELTAQFFEVNNDQVTKLDVIDYGRISDNTKNAALADHHIFFVGKVLIDDAGSTCFVHLFTLMFGSAAGE